MIETLMLTILTTFSPAQTQAQFRPCVWPNRCAKQAAAEEPEIKTCELPNRCS